MLGCLALCAMALHAAPEPGEVPASRFDRTITFLRAADPLLRADFAVTALRQLTDAYAREAELAQSQGRGTGSRDALLGWSRAVEQYAGRLALVLEDAETGFPVELFAGDRGEPAIAVADRTVILSHPRPDQQGAFELAVLGEFCSRHPCDEFTPGENERQPIPVSSGVVRPHWAFAETGPVCSHEGIEVHFGAGAELSRARPTCEQFMLEMSTLADEIAWQRRHGVVVEWRELSLHAIPGGTGHRLQLNGVGDAVVASVPVLHGSRGLLREAVPWLAARVEGRHGVGLTLRAADYGWESAPGED